MIKQITSPVVPPARTISVPPSNPIQPPQPIVQQPVSAPLPPLPQQLGTPAGLSMDWTQGEILNYPSSKGNSLVNLHIPAGTLRRKIYCYFYADTADTTFYANGEIEFWRNKVIKGKLPVSLAGSTVTSNQSFVSVTGNSGGNVQDCILLYLGSPAGSQPTGGVALEPFYVTGDFDSITFSLLGTNGTVNYVRAWLGCYSTIIENQ
jgi:hypothetical protein